MAAVSERVLASCGLMSLEHHGNSSSRNNNNSDSHRFEQATCSSSSREVVARVPNDNLSSDQSNATNNSNTANGDHEDKEAGDAFDFGSRLNCSGRRRRRRRLLGLGRFKVNNLAPSDTAVGGARAQDNQKQRQRPPESIRNQDDEQSNCICNEDDAQGRTMSHRTSDCCSSGSLPVLLAAKRAIGTHANGVKLFSNRSSCIIVNNNINIAKTLARPDALKLSTQLVFIIVLTVVPNIITSSHTIVDQSSSSSSNNATSASSATSTNSRPNIGDGLWQKFNRTIDDYYLPIPRDREPPPLPLQQQQPQQQRQQPKRQSHTNALFNGQQQSIHLARRIWPATMASSGNQQQLRPSLEEPDQKRRQLVLSQAAGDANGLPDTNQLRSIGRLYQPQQQQPAAAASEAALGGSTAGDGRLADSAQLSPPRLITSQLIGKTGSPLFSLPPRQLQVSAQQHQLGAADFGANKEQQQLLLLLQQQVSGKQQAQQQQQPLQLLRQTLAGARLFPTSTMGRLYSFLFPGSPLAQQQAPGAASVSGALAATNPQGRQQQQQSGAAGLSVPINRTTSAPATSSSLEPIQFASSNNHDLYTFAVTGANQEPSSGESFFLTTNQTEFLASGSQEQRQEPHLDSDRTHIINLSAPYESQARPVSQQQAAKIQASSAPINQQFELLAGNEDVKWRSDNASVIDGADIATDEHQHQQQLLAASSSEPAIAGGDETTVAAAAAQIGAADSESMVDDGSGLVQMDSSHLNSQATFEQQQQESLDSAGNEQQQAPQQGDVEGGLDGQAGDSEAAQLAASFATDQAESGSAIFGARQQPGARLAQSGFNGSAPHSADGGNHSDHQYSLEPPAPPSSGPVEGEFSEMSAEQLSALQLQMQHQSQVAVHDGAEDASGSLNAQSVEGGEAGENRAVVYSTAAVVPPDGLVAGANQSDISETPSSDADESYLTIHLPSQYDAVIRVPPEGYYDDYFKPAPATEISSLHSDDNGQESSSSPPFSTHQFGNHEESTMVSSNASQTAATDEASSTDDELRQFSRHNLNSSHLIAPPMAATVTSNLSFSTGTQRQQLLPANANIVAAGYHSQYPLRPALSEPQKQQERRKQQPMKPSEQLEGEQSIEFVASPKSENANFTSGSDAAEANDKRQQQRQPHMMMLMMKGNLSYAPLNYSQQQQQPVVGVLTKAKYSNQSSSTISPKSSENPNEDSIQLIIANTNSSARDPLSNEKIINYVNEPGYNVSRPIGKPARHTFVNKDMNELPPADEQHQGNLAPIRQQQPRLPPAGANQHSSGGQQSYFEPENHTRTQHQQNLYHHNPNQQQRQPIFHGRGERVDKPLNVSNANNDHDNNGERPFAVDEDKQELERVPIDAPAGNTAFGRYNNSSYSSTPAGAKVSRQDHLFQAQEPMERSSNENNYARLSRKQRNNNGNKSERQQQQQQQQQQRLAATANHNQHLVPQVTQANFNPKDLILNPPTPRPPLGAKSAVESVRKLRTSQPDKNELMNELLTALDRVKVAIYKLQPLTAKMNAIYRKSVTSNTRNIIMDNHKGTYAKRYPPGDYDDAYDRLHPSELLERDQSMQTQAAAGSNRLRGRGVQQQQQQQQQSLIPDHHSAGQREPPLDSSVSSQSVAPGTYLPAARGLRNAPTAGTRLENRSGSGSGNNSKTQHQRFARAAGSLEGFADIRDESILAPIVATGVGRRLADGRIRGELKLSSDQVDYYDNIDSIAEVGNYSPSTIMSDARRATMTLANNDKDNRTKTRAPTGTIAPGEAGALLDINHPRRQLLDPSLVADSAAPDFVPPDQLLDDSEPQSPLFGYRITIFQSEPTDSSGEEAKANEQFSYKIDGFEQQSPSDDRQQVAGSAITLDGNSTGPNFDLSNEEEGLATASTASEDDLDEDIMATSESSVNEAFRAPDSSDGSRSSSLSYRGADEAQIADNPDVVRDRDDQQDRLDVQESKGKKVKEDWKKEKSSKSEEKGHKRKGAKAEENKKEKSKKNMSRKKKDEEESKRKKEYKKVKHNKGILSKEKKSMHRDKHVKAHDRGAAKEKALKERTQIEFFEREQIVDDEYEKAKKSTSKAGWQSGHDKKKSTSDHGGDSMGSLGSGHHYAIHQGEPNDQMYAASGQSASVETSNAKQSNKFEKKNMESKGKKFKGWREKGYKIITETEFIDRGSLHDSGYKKRDKGAAHHQKFKKQESSSEGQHGSLQEVHKKSHKKEEKKSKMQEKKDKQSKKDEEIKKEKKKDKKSMVEKKKKKKKKKKHSKDHEHGESVMRPANANPNDDEGDDDADDEPEDIVEGRESAPGFRRQPALAGTQPTKIMTTKPQSVLLVASASTLRPALAKVLVSPDSSLTQGRTSPASSTLMRLLNANHDERPALKFQIKADPFPSPANNYTTILQPTNNNNTYHQQNRPALNQIKYHVSATIGDSSPSDLSAADNSNRRSDTVLPTAVQSMKSASKMTPGTIGSNATRSSNPATIVIVDNSTGRQANKTRIGLYELVDNYNSTIGNLSAGNLNSNPLVGGVKNTLAKYFPSASHRAPVRDSNPAARQPQLQSSVGSKAAAESVPISYSSGVGGHTKGTQNDQQAHKDNGGAPLLLSLLQKADALMQQQQQQQHSTIKSSTLPRDNQPLVPSALHSQQPLIGRDHLTMNAGLRATSTLAANQADQQQQQLMQLVQTAAAQGMTATQQPTNLIELPGASFQQPQPDVQFLSAASLPPSNTYQQAPTQLFTGPQMSFMDSSNQFEVNQFHDYEPSDGPLFSAHQLSQNFLIDQFN